MRFSNAKISRRHRQRAQALRRSLDAINQEEQTVRLAAIYKKLGLVQAANAMKEGRPKKKSEPNVSGHLLSAPLQEEKPSPPLPTTTQKLSADLGISDDQVRNRTNNVAKATGIHNCVHEYVFHLAPIPLTM